MTLNLVPEVMHYENRPWRFIGIKSKNRKEWYLFKEAKCLLCQETTKDNADLPVLLSRFEQLQLVYNYRQSLQQIWLKKVSSQKELIESLNQWCKKAEQSGLDVLHQFSIRLKSYV